MNSFWIYSWKNDIWKTKTDDLQFGEDKLRYAASDNFHKRGVKVGDSLFIVAVKTGLAYLGGVIQVNSLEEKNNAAKKLGTFPNKLWKASQYALAKPGSEDIFRPRLPIPDTVINNLWLEYGSSDQRTAKRNANGRIDPQTFRTIRKLIPGEESKLLDLL